MDKPIALVVGDEVRDAVVRSGMTTHDLRVQAHVPQTYFVSPPNGLPWGDNEIIYNHVTPGMKVFASPAANVANLHHAEDLAC